MARVRNICKFVWFVWGSRTNLANLSIARTHPTSAESHTLAHKTLFLGNRNIINTYCMLKPGPSSSAHGDFAYTQIHMCALHWVGKWHRIYACVLFGRGSFHRVGVVVRGGAAFVSVAVTAATRAGGAAAVVKRMCVAHAYPDININILRKRTPTCVQYKPCPGPVNMLPPTPTPVTIYKYVCSVYPMSPGHVRSL